MDTVTVTLASPIEHNGKTYSELTFRKAKLGDMIAADAVGGVLGKTAAALASIAGIPYPAFKELSMRDMNAVLEKVGHLLGNAPAPAGTGAA
jgi:hypothetical protein